MLKVNAPSVNKPYIERYYELVTLLNVRQQLPRGFPLDTAS